MTGLLLEAGLPAEGIQCLTGPGGTVGDALCRDARVRKITFTGSHAVGRHLCPVAGLKRVTMELGSSAPLVVMADADLDKVAAATVATGYANAGQVCISAQRVLVDRKVYTDFADLVRQRAEALVVGDPLDEKTAMGPMIGEPDARRVNEWIHEAVRGGARLLAGGEHQGALHAPTVLADVNPGMRASRDELFGPAVALTPFATIDEAIAAANDTRYGLSAGIFTQNLDWALRFARQVHAGNLHINWGPQWRADLMPYGGLKDSGMGKEGPRYAVEEMTEVKLVVFHQER
ncbi:MAG: aldehyde dehydrogenase family protein [Candidatus Latescibacterota bacterium]